MGVYTFQWPREANEVYVTGSFDNWTRSVRLDRTHDGFAKEVRLPDSGEKVLYKFIVDGAWKTDETAPQEDDGHNNINNVLPSENIRQEHTTTEQANNTGIMSGVKPDSTTAGLAASVPKESAKGSAAGKGLEGAAISSVAPDSTTAELAKDVPLEGKPITPGTFPETPVGEPESFSVKPIPATGGIGNPVQLNPGEKVPDPANFTNNTVGSAVTTDQAGYERDASDPQMAFLAAQQNGNTSTNPTTGGSSGVVGTGHISSAAPGTTTAGLAGSTPLESRRVSEPAEDVPSVVKESIYRANSEPEAAGSERAVEEKKEVEEELLDGIEPEQSHGEPAPTAKATGAGAAAAPAALGDRQPVRDLSPKSRDPTAMPSESGQAGQPVVTNGPATSTAPETSTMQPESLPTEPTQPAQPTQPTQPTQTTQQKPSQLADAGKQTGQNGVDDAAKAGRRKSRMSEFFSKIKEKLK